jgi:hypothetical protein
MGAGKMMMNTRRDLGDGPRAELGMRLRILKMMQNWSGLMELLTMQNLSSFSVTLILTLRIGLQDVTNRWRATNPRRHAWTGKTVGTVWPAPPHAMPTNVNGTSRRSASGGQTANCNACTE